MTTQTLLGQDQYGDIIFAEIKDGKVRGFNGFYLYTENQTYDGNNYLNNTSWTHKAVINGITFERGDIIDLNIKPYFTDKEVETLIIDNDYCTDDGFNCSECGTFHSTDQYRDISYVVLNECELYCKSCVETNDMLTLLENGEDLFKSKDITSMDDPTNFVEVETLFCDSSGFGSSSEAALTQDQATNKTNDLIEEHGELFAGITGMGQFQVYVTLYKVA